MTPAEWFERFPDLERHPLFTLRLKIAGGARVTIRAFEGPHDGRNHTTLYCELWRGSVSGQRAPLFPKDAFWVGIPGHQSIDSDAAKECVLSLFAMRPGDTDADFFKDYTPEQLAFVQAHGEELTLIALDRYGEP